MILDSVPLSLLRARLHYGSRRQEVISANIANASIPNAKTMDLKPFAQAVRMMPLQPISMVTTSPRHIKANKFKAEVFSAHPSGFATDLKLNGNNINIKTEALKMSANALQYQQALATYGRILGMVNIALSGGR